MTPIELARAIGKLPGAPTPVLAHLDTAYQRPDGLGWRNLDGLGWVRDPEDFAHYVLDLDDAATGGVLSARIGEGVNLGMTGNGWTCSYWDATSNVDYETRGASLAIALARIIIARGGWNV